MKTLVIDTSTNILGIAILDEKALIAQKITRVSQDHSSRLMPAIVSLMEEVKIEPQDLKKIIVAEGPGSYTGVRIGVTVGKSLAWALNIPIIGVSSLELLAYQAKLSEGLICSFFDARRENVFAGVYRVVNRELTIVEADTNISFANLDQKLCSYNEKVILLSPDIEKFLPIMSKELNNLAVIPDATYHISNPSHLALIGQKKSVNNTHTLTPQYLRMAEAEANWLKANQKDKE